MKRSVAILLLATTTIISSNLVAQPNTSSSNSPNCLIRIVNNSDYKVTFTQQNPSPSTKAMSLGQSNGKDSVDMLNVYCESNKPIHAYVMKDGKVIATMSYDKTLRNGQKIVFPQHFIIHRSICPNIQQEFRRIGNKLECK